MSSSPSMVIHDQVRHFSTSVYVASSIYLALEEGLLQFNAFSSRSVCAWCVLPSQCIMYYKINFIAELAFFIRRFK